MLASQSTYNRLLFFYSFQLLFWRLLVICIGRVFLHSFKFAFFWPLLEWLKYLYSVMQMHMLGLSDTLSICTRFLKSLVHEIYFRTWFLTLYFLSISNLIFTACVACKNQVWNRQKIKFKNQVQKSILWTRYFKNQVQMDRGRQWADFQIRIHSVGFLSIKTEAFWEGHKNIYASPVV